jgi:DivIVA domain-containing protein
MEMSPKAIAAVTFPVVRKGYDPEQVRSFLSQLSRGVEELQNRALQAEAKARLTAAAPAPATETTNMESITKTLVIAQRTADATLSDARTEADGIRKQATERAETILAEAKAQGAQIVTAAEQEALRTADVTRSRVAAEVDALENRRQALLEDVDTLSTHITTQRGRLVATVEILNQALEHPDGLQETPMPQLAEGRQAAGEDAGPGGTAGTDEGDAGGPPTEAIERTGSNEAADVAEGGGALPFPAPASGSSSADVPDPVTQELPLIGDREAEAAWPSFMDEEPKGDDRWKR